MSHHLEIDFGMMNGPEARQERGADNHHHARQETTA